VYKTTDLQEEILQKATIYSKESTRPLTNYQKEINKASQTLCLQNPGLLHIKRLELIQMARQKILDDGFQFKKGKTRSKTGLVSDPVFKPKQPKNLEFREKRVVEIDEKIEDLNERINYKEKRIQECIGISDYEKCDFLKKEIMSLKEDIRLLLAEKDKLKTSIRKSKWYYKKKSANSDVESSASTSSSSTVHTSINDFGDTDFYPLTPSLCESDSVTVHDSVSDGARLPTSSNSDHSPSDNELVMNDRKSHEDDSQYFHQSLPVVPQIQGGNFQN
jgi:hypothetical protein